MEMVRTNLKEIESYNQEFKLWDSVLAAWNVKSDTRILANISMIWLIFYLGSQLAFQSIGRSVSQYLIFATRQMEIQVLEELSCILYMLKHYFFALGVKRRGREADH
jgi:hypothetical protein